MTDSPFFNYMRMEPNRFDEIIKRVGLGSKRVTPTSGNHLNQAVEVGQNAGIVAEVATEAPRLSMPKLHSRGGEARWSVATS